MCVKSDSDKGGEDRNSHREREREREREKDGECDAFRPRANWCTRVNLVIRALPSDSITSTCGNRKRARAHDDDREDSRA